MRFSSAANAFIPSDAARVALAHSEITPRNLVVIVAPHENVEGKLLCVAGSLRTEDVSGGGGED